MVGAGQQENQQEAPEEPEVKVTEQEALKEPEAGGDLVRGG
jgi:hypothetical protein